MSIHRQMSSVLVVAWMATWGTRADAQTLGNFSWQLQPFCNVVTVNVVQTGAVYTLDGYDDQCGAAQRAPLTGLATPNPDGTIGFGLNIVTVPGGKAVSVDARINLAGLSGPWTDSAGNSGTFAFGGSAAGAPRPAPSAPGIAPGSVSSAALAPGAVTTGAIADGAVGAADINSAEVQRRISSTCPTGLYLTGVDAAGVPTCSDGPTSYQSVSLGVGALRISTGAANTAVGDAALYSATTGAVNTAVGSNALSHIVDGSHNAAFGSSALEQVEGFGNTGIGVLAGRRSTTTSGNTAVGYRALYEHLTPGNNTAVGFEALLNSTGGGNVALGRSAGSLTTTGFNNIHISHVGDAADNATIRIGGQGVQTRAFLAGVRNVTTATAAVPVLVGTDGQLGTISSSRRYKFDIADMDDYSARLGKLRPVTFRYKQPMADGSTPLDFGLIAEEVAEVFPELAVRGADGPIETVAYHKLPALLLNELQKLQRVVAAQAVELLELRAAVTAGRPQ